MKTQREKFEINWDLKEARLLRLKTILMIDETKIKLEYAGDDLTLLKDCKETIIDGEKMLKIQSNDIELLYKELVEYKN